MAKKTVNFNKTGLGKLPASKPVMYKIKTKSGKVNYVGVAKRGRVQERLKEHLSGEKDYVPGAKVQIEQFGSIEEARKKETSVIANALTQRPRQVKSSARTGRIARNTARSVVKRISNTRTKR